MWGGTMKYIQYAGQLKDFKNSFSLEIRILKFYFLLFIP